ncbi:kinase-like domain-containing protein, partial [Gilbertella persicaria]|uniref:kinase-like domain-containing protein n=1 Tax=Gilbertella persicaria TaxID=101096 RepID=UPI0022205397
MPNLIHSDTQISVFETRLTIEQNTLSVFNIVIQSPQSSVSLIRYPFDLVEFHQKIRLYYPKSKVSFPTLSNPSKRLRCLKRRSFRDLLPFARRKSNADKVEKYLEACFQHPIIGISSIFRDFTSVQRDEDVYLTSRFRKSVAEPTNVPNRSNVTSITIDDFRLLKVLGKGCMGKVLLVRSKKDQKLYALKSIKKKWVIQQKELIHTRAERDILVHLQNQPFLVHLNHVFQTHSELFLVLDYYAGGDIATHLSNMSHFSQEQTRFYAVEIILGLDILHQNGIVYRDLKPENVLIGQNGHIVLTDFGLSKMFTYDDIDEFSVPSTQTFCGTAEYLAPEVLLGEPYTYAVDFWSLGTLLYEMLAGTTPFWADSHMEMYKRVLEDSLEFPSSFGESTKDLLAGLLEKEAFHRLGWGEDGIDCIKSHPYFESIDWDKAFERNLTPPYVPNIKDEADASNFDELFTAMPVQISQSSVVDMDQVENLPGFCPGQDPFKGFSFESSEQTSSENQHVRTLTRKPACFLEHHPSNSKKIRKRHNDAVSLTRQSSGWSMLSNQSVEGVRVTKKRHVSPMFPAQNSHVSSLGEQTAQGRRTSSICSLSSVAARPVQTESQLEVYEQSMHEDLPHSHLH